MAEQFVHEYLDATSIAGSDQLSFRQPDLYDETKYKSDYALRYPTIRPWWV